MIAFLRTQESVASAGPQGDHINLLGALVFFSAGKLPAPAPVAHTITAPPTGATPEYGKHTDLGGAAASHAIFLARRGRGCDDRMEDDLAVATAAPVATKVPAATAAPTGGAPTSMKSSAR